MRKILVFLSFIFALRAETPYCEIRGLQGGALSSTPLAVGTVWGIAIDASTGSPPTYNVTICYDGLVSCDTAVQSNKTSPDSSISYQFNYTIPSGSVGSVTPKDGQRHQIYAYMASNTQGNVNCAYGGGYSGLTFPFQWTNATIAPLMNANLEPSPARGITASTLGVLVNSSDTYSIGTSGSTVCAAGAVSPSGSATAVLSDGVAGTYINKYSIPCANVCVVAQSVTSTISDTTYNSNIKPCVSGFSSSIQGVAVAWLQPYGVYVAAQGSNYSQSISSAVARNGLLTWNALVTISGVALIDTTTNSNPYFNTTSQAPYTDYGIRPTMMLVGETCPTCTANDTHTGPWVASVSQFTTQLNNTYTANNTNPTGNAYLEYAGGGYGSTNAAIASSLSLGTVLSPKITLAMNGSSASPANGQITQSNILFYASSTKTPTQSGSTWKQGGICWAENSNGGQLISATNETTFAWYLLQGCSVGAGAVSEPLIIATKYPFMHLAIPYMYSGLTMLEVVWKSTQIPAQINFGGDPLATPYLLSSTSQRLYPINILPMSNALSN